jgi:hypothetical protein
MAAKSMSILDRKADAIPADAVRNVNGRESELGRRLRRLRQQYIAEGGILLTAPEIEAEIANRRGEHSSKD